MIVTLLCGQRRNTDIDVHSAERWATFRLAPQYTQFDNRSIPRQVGINLQQTSKRV